MIQAVSQQPYLTSNELVQLPVIYNPDYKGRKSHIVTAVDSSTRNLIHSWLIHAKSQPPNITKRFDVKIDLNERKLTSKKLPVYNPYSIPRTFKVSTSRPDLTTPDKEIIQIPPNQSYPLSIHFHNIFNHPVVLEILIFIQNADTGQQEETFAVNVSYDIF
ncbi:unnamed protein product [Auanema sp. JU1783]|nr:unnamed protein product [Auanema sp. JU1783]